MTAPTKAGVTGTGLDFQSELRWWPLRLALSILDALVMVRALITFHDYMHGAILRNSRAAQWLLRLYAGLALTPASSWKKAITIIMATSAGSVPPVSAPFR